jgi:hypothetical protein
VRYHALFGLRSVALEHNQQILRPQSSPFVVEVGFVHKAGRRSGARDIDDYSETAIEGTVQRWTRMHFPQLVRELSDDAEPKLSRNLGSIDSAQRIRQQERKTISFREAAYVRDLSLALQPKKALALGFELGTVVFGGHLEE